jgi:FAD/FMN-containing dehydrogenase
MSAVDITGLEGGRVAVDEAHVEELETRIGGEIVRPSDPGWDEAVEVWNGMVAKSPRLVVQPHTARDVAAVVDFSRRHGLLLSVKGGGHHIAGTALTDGGVTLDMSAMRSVTVDPDVRLANAGPGCRLGDVDRATQEHGLATVLGFISKTGVAGLTLGGGMGYLTRRFGYGVDNLDEVEIVTADGEIRVANRREHADLFWALRGGGGNFGVVTRFTFRLHEVGPLVHGGLIAWPFERAEEVLSAYREITSDAPRELAVWQMLLTAPPAPFVPPEWHGRRICGMAVCYSGDPARADAVLAPVRALGDPVFDVIREQPYVELQSYLDGTEPNGMHYYWKTEFAAALDDGLLKTVRDVFADCPLPMADIGFLHLGGALNDRAADDGAVGNRDARYAVGIKGMWAPDHPTPDANREWVRQAWQRIRPFSTGGNYVNFQTADDERIAEAYGANYDRLREVKSAYDADNLFRVNRNIPPSP